MEAPNDFYELEILINTTIEAFNSINAQINSVIKIIKDYDDDIKESTKIINELNSFLLNADTTLFKFSSPKMKAALIRESIHNCKKHQQIIRESHKRKEKAINLHKKYLKMLKCVYDNPALECKVCFEYKKEILAGTKCGHLICNACYKQIVKTQDTPKCPTCMAPYQQAAPIKIYI